MLQEDWELKAQMPDKSAGRMLGIFSNLINFDPEKLEELGLYQLLAEPSGLTIDQRNALKALVYLNLIHPKGFTT